MSNIKIQNSISLDGGITLTGNISGANIINAQQILVNGVAVALSGQGGSSLANVADDGTGVRLGDVVNNSATGAFAVAAGKDTTASGYGSFSTGTVSISGNIIASGEGSFASGRVVGYSYNGYYGICVHGGNIVSSGNGSFAIGFVCAKYSYNGGNIIAGGCGSRAEGIATYNGNISVEAGPYGYNGKGSRAEGYANGGTISAGGKGSHAEGNANSGGTISANGYGSHAEGYSGSSSACIIASGTGSHAQGTNVQAIGNFSQAIGSGARANNHNSFVWSDGTEFSSYDTQTFNIHATKGVHIDGGDLFVNGSPIIDILSSNISSISGSLGDLNELNYIEYVSVLSSTINNNIPVANNGPNPSYAFDGLSGTRWDNSNIGPAYIYKAVDIPTVFSKIKLINFNFYSTTNEPYLMYPLYFYGLTVQGGGATLGNWQKINVTSIDSEYDYSSFEISSGGVLNITQYAGWHPTRNLWVNLDDTNSYYGLKLMRDEAIGFEEIEAISAITKQHTILYTINELHGNVDSLSSSITAISGDVTTLETSTVGITGGLSQLDTRFINTSGDTMTGALQINNNLTVTGTIAVSGLNNTGLLSTNTLSVGTLGASSDTVKIGGGSVQSIYRDGADGSGIHFTTNSVVPATETGTASSNTEDLGSASYRWKNIHSNGITLSGGTTISNYEEGTWTPAFTLGSGSCTYATQAGTYTRIGRQVTLCGFIALASVTTPSGTLSISGLPFSTPSNDAYRSSPAFAIDHLVGLNVDQVAGEMLNSGIGVYRASTVDLVNDLAGYLDNDTNIRFSVTYFV
jgi:hypothetical protein